MLAYRQKMILLGLAGFVVVLVVMLWDDNLESAIVLLGAVLLLGFLLLAGWRQAEQEARDREEIRKHQESQRRQAADMPRDDPRDS